MKLHSVIKSRIIPTICGAMIAAAALAVPAQADDWNKKTILTVNEPIQVTKTLLPPGQYVFRLLDSQSNRHVVVISNAREDHVMATILAIPNYRLEPTGDSQFRFWETPPGRVKALRAWFYPGDNTGEEFPYPKELAMAQTTASAAIVSTPAVVAATPEPQSQPQPVPEPQTAQVETAPVAAQEQQPAQMAENTPPPATAEAESEPAPAPPAELPKTASSYPMIGLSGLVLLGIGGFLRRKQLA
jgi:LPXTG-motif cell wall-anchored protein